MSSIVASRGAKKGAAALAQSMRSSSVTSSPSMFPSRTTRNRNSCGNSPSARCFSSSLMRRLEYCFLVSCGGSLARRGERSAGSPPGWPGSSTTRRFPSSPRRSEVRKSAQLHGVTFSMALVNKRDEQLVAPVRNFHPLPNRIRRWHAREISERGEAEIGAQLQHCGFLEGAIDTFNCPKRAARSRVSGTELLDQLRRRLQHHRWNLFAHALAACRWGRTMQRNRCAKQVDRGKPLSAHNERVSAPYSTARGVRGRRGSLAPAF